MQYVPLKNTIFIIFCFILIENLVRMKFCDAIKCARPRHANLSMS
jgi:hypothetical protein